MSDLRKTCDFGDKHFRLADKRWSWEWMAYFHMCPKCLRKWDKTHDSSGHIIEPMFIGPL